MARQIEKGERQKASGTKSKAAAYRAKLNAELKRYDSEESKPRPAGNLFTKFARSIALP